MFLKHKLNAGFWALIIGACLVMSMPAGKCLASNTHQADHGQTKLKSSAQVTSGSMEKEKKKAEALKQELNLKAVQAVAETYKVVELLNQKKSDEALEQLKKVIGELEVILAANKDISLVPVNSYTVAMDTDMSPEEISTAISEVKKMLNKGNVQEARLLLDTLQSEIDIIIENLPLATYPDAMKLASKYIIDKKLDEAKSVLTVALNSMVIKKIIIPLPLVRAADLIEEASKTASVNKKQALKYLDNAKKQLEIAKLLGYGKDDPKIYKDLQDRIDAIKTEIKGKNKAAKMFEELLKKLGEFKKKLLASGSTSS